VGNEEEWQRFCKAIGQSTLATDVRFATLAARKENEDALEQIVTTWTNELSPDEVTQKLQHAGVAAYPTLDGNDLLANPHVAARGYFVELEHAEVGKRRHLGIPWKMSRTPCEIRRPAPLFGQDTDYVLEEVIGLSSDEIAALRTKEVLV